MESRPNVGRRRRGRNEVVFGVMKALWASERFWGENGGVSYGDLADIVGAAGPEIAGAVRYLIEGRIVTLDEVRRTVRLTRRGLREINGGRSRS